MFAKNVLGIGPYVGTFEWEMTTFLPHVNWISELLKDDNKTIFINSHYNREFLYNNFNFVPVYTNLTRDENGQINTLHNRISKSDYNICIKKFKESIVDFGYTKKESYIHNLPYKQRSDCSFFNKKYDKINIGIEDKYKDKIVLIPYPSYSEKFYKKIKDCLQNEYNDYVIVGDMKTHLLDDNVIINGNSEYFKNGYEQILKYITVARAVVVPESFWVLVANLQNTPIFSWGNNISQYKPDGLYNFDNDKTFIIPFDYESDVKILISYLTKFLKNL